MTERLIEISTPTSYEAIAPRFDVLWDPATNTGPINWFLRDMVYRDGVYCGMTGHNAGHREQIGAPEVEDGRLPDRIEDVMAATLVVDGVEYPGALLMGLVKARFDQRFKEYFVEKAAADAEAARVAAEAQALMESDAAAQVAAQAKEAMERDSG